MTLAKCRQKRNGITRLGSVDLPYVQKKTNAQGRTYWLYRRAGRYVRLPGSPGSDEWLAVYWAERQKDDVTKARADKQTRVKDRTFNRLSLEFYNSPGFKKLAASTRRAYRSNLNGFLEQYGHLPVAGVKFQHVNKIIGDMDDRPGAANNLLKRLREMFKLAKRLEWIDRDPSEGVSFYRLGEIHTWTDDEIAQFCKRWKPGTTQRLAFMVQLHTGQRNSDVVKEPWPRDGEIRVTQIKTGAHLWIPVMPELAQELALHPVRHALILATDSGRPRSTAGYGNMMRAAIRAAKLPARCTPHGLRKAAAAHLAEAGCTTREIMAITGHATLAEVERYTRAVDQRRLAKDATAKRSANTRLGTTTISGGNDPNT